MKLTTNEIRKEKPSRTEFNSIGKIPIVIVLDNVKSSYNIGSIIRLADAFRVEAVWVCGVNKISETRMKKTSRGLTKWINIEFYKSTTEAVKELSSRGYFPSCIELCSNSVSYKNANYVSKMAMVMGSETNGIDSDVVELCSQNIYVPMLGMGNSLNVATACAIVLSEAVAVISC